MELRHGVEKMRDKSGTIEDGVRCDRRSGDAG